MIIYQYFNKPTELNHWHPDDPNNEGSVKYRNEKGELHRLDGPAVITPDFMDFWFENNKCIGHK